MQSIKKHLFYSKFNNTINIGDFIFIDKSETNHLRNSLRKKENDIIEVFNGKGIVIKGRIIETSKQFTKIIIDDIKKYEKHNLISAIIPLFNSNRLDFSIHKLTELGIYKIYIYNPDFNNKKEKNIIEKTNRWRRICISACKQSHNAFLPEIFFLKDLSEIKNFNGDFIVPFELETKNYLNDILPKIERDNIYFIVGSEGGFSHREINILQKKPVNFIKLTDTILRVETAIIYTASIITYFFNK